MKNIAEFARSVGAHCQWLQQRKSRPGRFWFLQILLLGIGSAALLGSLTALLTAVYLQASWGPYALLAAIRDNDVLLSQALDQLQDFQRLQLLFRMEQVLFSAKLLLGAFALMQGAFGLALLALAYVRAQNHETLDKSLEFATHVGVQLAQETQP